jgi:uncharacterized surface protein with fasciclin (FAS1) repeats
MKTKDLSRLALLLSLAAATPAAFAEDSPAEKSSIGESAVEAVKDTAEAAKGAVEKVKNAIEGKSITDLVSDSTTFSTLKKALKAAELDVTLGSKGAYTLFAPTDEAFDKLPAGTLSKLLLPENKEKLRSLLLYHVVPGKLLAAELKNGEVKTLNGEKVKIDADGKKVEVNQANVYGADISANNGVVHTIGKVLVPESLKGFQGL